MSWISASDPWTWIIAGLVLVGLEVLAPGAFMLWLGLAALATGLLAFVVPLSLEAEALIFACLAIASVLLGRRLMGPMHRHRTGAAELNNRAAQLIGRRLVLETPISEGRGRVRVDDTTWPVEGPDLPIGAQIRVTGVEGTLLRVVEA